MVNDPIADLLTRLRNAYLRKHNTISLPSSKMLVAITDILKASGYIESYQLHDDSESVNKVLEIKLKYVLEEPAIRSIKRISKPGLRKYLNYKEIPKVLNGKGIGIFSTPKGVLSGDDAKKNKVGGEYLCEIW